MEVFEHIPIEKAGNFIQSVANLLSPEGVLYVTVPHINKNLEYKHFRHFSSKSLIEAFSPYFEATGVIPIEKKCLAKNWMNKLLVNKYFILNHGALMQFIYKYYKKRLFFAKEPECQRIIVRMKLKAQ